MDRLTKKYAGGYGLVKVKDNEQDLESPYPNTLRACFESWQRLAAYEDTGLAPEGVEALKSERDRLKARLEVAVSDMDALADREADPCDFCDSKGACHRPDSCPRAGYRNFKWRGPQEGANQ